MVEEEPQTTEAWLDIVRRLMSKVEQLEAALERAKVDLRVVTDRLNLCEASHDPLYENLRKERRKLNECRRELRATRPPPPS